MNTIKKTTLIAVITTMAAIAVPSMASAAVWLPVNTNKTLTATFPVVYATNTFTVNCANSTLGVRAKGGLGLDVTSASFTNCTASSGGSPCGPATVTATVNATTLYWPVTSSGAPNVTFTEHLTVVPALCWPGSTFNIDGPVTGTYNNPTHTLSVHPTSPMILSLSGTPVEYIFTYNSHTYHETTNTLTLT